MRSLSHALISIHLFFSIVWRAYDELPDGTQIRFNIRQAYEMAVLTYQTRKVIHE